MDTRTDGVLQQVRAAAIFTVASFALLGILYPLLITGVAALLLPVQADGSLVRAGGRVIGSDIVGQRFVQARYFHGRPSAAGKDGYDPTATGGTNLGPTSKKLFSPTGEGRGCRQPQCAALEIRAGSLSPENARRFGIK